MIALLILVLSALSPASPVFAGEPKAAEAFVEAARLLKLGRRVEALAAARQELALIESAPAASAAESARVLGAFGKFARSAGDEEAVKKTLDRLAALPQDAAVVAARARLLNGERRFEEGLRISTAAAALHPEIADIHMQAADAFLGLGRRAEAVEAYRRVLALAPSDYEARLRLADAYRLDGRFKEASGLYREAQALAPGRAAAYFEEGYSRRDDGDAAGAVGALEAAIASNPKNPDLHHHLGVLLASSGRGDDAVRSFEAALRLHPPEGAGTAHTKTHLGRQLHALGRRDDALRLYREVLASAPLRTLLEGHVVPDYLDALIDGGLETEGRELMERALEACRSGCSPMVDAAVFGNMAKLLRRSESARAREYGRRAVDSIVSIAPGDPYQCRMVSGVASQFLAVPPLDSDRDRLERLRRSADACSSKDPWVDLLETARIELSSSTPRRRLQAGDELLELGRRAEAVEAYRAALALAPNDYDTHLRLAGAYRLEGRFEEASGLYRKAQRLAPGSADAYFKEGYARRDDGDGKGAVRVLEEAVASRPKDALLRHHLGVLLTSAGRIGEAVKSFETALGLYDPAEKKTEQFADTRTFLARQFHALGRHDEALRTYREAFADAPPKDVQWCTAALGCADELQELGRDEEARTLVVNAIESCRTGCHRMVRARLLVRASRLFKTSDSPRSRDYGRRAVESLLEKPPVDVHECRVTVNVLTQSLYIASMESELDRLEELGRSVAACMPKSTGLVHFKRALGDVRRARGDASGAHAHYCEAYRAAAVSERKSFGPMFRASGLADPERECGKD